MNIYVGNLAKEVTDQELRETFEAYGQVESAIVLKDKFSGESRGFGFVEMRIRTEAEEAIKQLDSKEIKGRHLIVNEARPRRENRGGGGRGGQRGSGGRGGRGGGFRRF
jgi:RNA recognition motif-containing protein